MSALMTRSLPPSPQLLCVGVVAGAHGVRGGVRIKSFTAMPEDVGAYGPVSDEAAARRFGIRVTGLQKGIVLAKLDGISSRDEAEALKGLRLYVERDKLPPAEEETYYHADLIGLAADLVDGQPLGKIVSVWDFGAGDSVEIQLPDGHTIMVPFTKACVPTVDLAAGRVVIEPPAGLFDKPEPPASVEDQGAVAAEILGSETP